MIHSDDEVWDVLRSVNMIDHVQSLPNKLDEFVSEGGDNFSAGQRQVSFSLGNDFVTNVYYRLLFSIVDLYC